VILLHHLESVEIYNDKIFCASSFLDQCLQDPVSVVGAELPPCVCGELNTLTAALKEVHLAASLVNLHSREPGTQGRAKELSVRESNCPSPQCVSICKGEVNIKRVLTIQASSLWI
jgi:hypothetical protein